MSVLNKQMIVFGHVLASKIRLEIPPPRLVSLYTRRVLPYWRLAAQEAAKMSVMLTKFESKSNRVKGTLPTSGTRRFACSRDGC